jgi:hypothetical protein
MKTTTVTVVIVALVAMTFALPATSLAWGHGGRWHGGGWYGAGAFAGGLLLGAAIADPWYPPYVYSGPPVVYTAPPDYAQSQGYAYSDPALSAPQEQNQASGQWIVVPGQ